MVNFAREEMMADRLANAEIGRTGVEDTLVDEAVDARIAEMRRLLEQMAEPSSTAALRALRYAFPDAPLAERVRAMKYSRH